MNETAIKHFKEILLEQKEELLDEFKLNNSFGLDEGMNDSIGELSGYDNHPADIGTELYEREKDIGLRENQMHIFDLVNQALERIENGTYGYCLECKKEIPNERLEALPYAQYCIEHQRNDHASERRPVEEEVLYPPYGRTSLDEKDFNGVDGEDIWQSVAKFGTSNPPDYFRDGTDYDHLYIESREPVGFVDQVEGFIITDMDGNPSDDQVDITRNIAYEAYLDNFEGEEGIAEYHEEEDQGNK